MEQTTLTWTISNKNDTDLDLFTRLGDRVTLVPATFNYEFLPDSKAHSVDWLFARRSAVNITFIKH